MSVLEKIFATKRDEVAYAKSRVSVSQLRDIISEQEAPRGFLSALTNADGLGLIAEVKKASPSQGLIRPNFDPVQVARAYESVGAHALSVLTDEPYFQGSPENLKLAKRATRLPCLRKDFVDDPYQVYEARSWGADAVLLIVASLSASQLEDLRALIESLGMDALVEIHSAQEAELALRLKCPLIGVNNRDLSTFKTSLSISEELLPGIVASGAIGISESALESKHDLDRVEKAGARAVLIGTSFCSSPDIPSKVKEVMGW